MFRAIEIAKNAIRSSYPNPMVGCVIVHNDTIIGEGFTSAYGGPHAEVNAIDSVKDKSLLAASSIYVTLEPCSHFGKTPPCADLISFHRIPRVYIGCLDPNPEVAGKGILHLEKSGSEVHTGILRDDCEAHHKRFLCYQTKYRPYITLKWAQSLEGYFAPLASKRNKKLEPFWISNQASKQLVHQWRSEEHAILIGINTLLEDNPKLDVRWVAGINPIPIVIDPHLRITDQYHLYHHSDLLLIADIKNSHRAPHSLNIAYIDFNRNVIEQVLQVLYENQILSVLVEGGATTLQSFIDEEFWDEARIITGANHLTEGIKAPKVQGNPLKSYSLEGDRIEIIEAIHET